MGAYGLGPQFDNGSTTSLQNKVAGNLNQNARPIENGARNISARLKQFEVALFGDPTKDNSNVLVLKVCGKL